MAAENRVSRFARSLYVRTCAENRRPVYHFPARCTNRRGCYYCCIILNRNERTKSAGLRHISSGRTRSRRYVRRLLNNPWDFKHTRTGRCVYDVVVIIIYSRERRVLAGKTFSRRYPLYIYYVTIYIYIPVVRGG